jgi:hypothetical protein
MVIDATAIEAAAKICPWRSAPSSRAVRPVRKTIDPDASAEGSRSITKEPGASSDMIRATRGTSGGWSG